jgi:type I restriction enzyme S subunit
MPWPAKRLGDLCRTTSGGTPSRLKPEYFGGTISWVKSGDLNDGEIVQCDESLTDQGLQFSNAKLFDSGTLLIAMYGATVGKLGILGIPAATNQAVCAIFPSPELDRRFLFHFLLSIREKLIEKSTGGAQPNISQTIVRDLKIPLPPLAEQQRIVDILDRAAAIQRLRRAAEEKAREIIPALFVDMFGDPATNPKGWPMGSIGEVLTACDYGSSTKATDDAIGLPILRMGNVNTDGSLDLAKLKFVDLPEAEQQKYLLRRGDVLFNRTNSKELVGKTGLWLTDHEAVFASYFIRLRTDARRVLPEYLWAFLNSRASKARLFAMARGAIGQANINSKELKAIPLPLPPLQLQQRFMSRLDALNAMQSLHARAQEASAFTAQSLSFQILGDGA